MKADNKRIAKNAVMLTLRSILVAVIGLYTSRVVLEALGVTDYGVYGVIGGIVGLGGFLNTSMAAATSRFITFELGKGNEEKLKDIFVTSIRIHFLLALIVIFLAETIGLWFLNCKMVIPEDKMFAANILYQFTVFSILVGFTQVPYNASIIAHERMSIYAYFEILFVVLKLIIVFILLLAPSSRLILYGCLTFAVSLINRIFYRIYCTRHFPEANLKGEFNKELAKNMLKFSGLDLYGNMCASFKIQGQPIILNLFYGVIANAGSSIALTVTGQIQSLTGTISQAFRPQITKQYAQGNISDMQLIMKRSILFTLFAFGCISIPIIIETPRVLTIWLGQIPPYSVVFFRIIIISCIINSINHVTNAGVHSTGNIKIISFIGGTLFLTDIIMAYILLRIGLPAQTIYLIDIILYISLIIVGITSIYLLIKNFNIFKYITAILRSLSVIIITFISIYYIKKWTPLFDEYNSFPKLIEDLLVLLRVTIISFLILSCLTYILAFGKNERLFIKNKISNIFNKRLSLL